jgi:fido (protein-threonine AMPylation protein)
LSQEGNIRSDPYLYPDTSVLRNLADIRDANRLNQFESDHFFARLLELHENPICGSFGEGNGRAQREFIRELAVESCYEIAWDLITQDEMFAASVASFHGGSNEAFATILNKIIRPVR